jgi:hypothetical protein
MKKEILSPRMPPSIINVGKCALSNVPTIINDVSEVYEDYLKAGKMKRKLVKLSHTKFQENMWEGL